MRYGLKTTVTAGILALGLALSGCGGQNSTAASAANNGTPKTGGTLKIAFDPDTIKCVDPFQAQWIAARVIDRQFVDSLTDQDPKTGEIKPWLATDWTISDDGLTYTFNLQKGVTFSDGTPLDANAVATAFTNNIKTAKETATTGSNYIKGLETAEAVDDDTVKFTFSAPNASFLQATSTPTLGILSPSTYNLSLPERCAGGTASQKLIGSGPFTLEQYDPGSKTILKKRTGYSSPSPFYQHKGDAYLDGIEITYVSEKSVRTGNLLSGALDGAWVSTFPIDENDVKQFNTVGVTVESKSLPGTSFPLFPNVTDGRILSDANVRKALSYAIDRKSYAETVYRTGYPTPTGLLDQGTADGEIIDSITSYDPDQAKQLLDQAGWTVGPDGYRYKDGRKLTLSYIVETQQSSYELLQDQLKKVGIDLQIKVDTAAQMVTDKSSGNYDLAWSTYTRNDPSALNTLLDARVSPFKPIASRTRTPELNAKLEALFDQGSTETDATKRAEIYKQLQQTIADTNTVIVVNERTQDFARTKNVNGFQFSAESYALFDDVWLSR